MSSRRHVDELTRILDSIREYCSQKRLKVFPGLVGEEETLKVRWSTPRADDWRAFLDIAAALSVQIVYLDSSTLADAFGAVHVHAPHGNDPYERLYILIGRVSAEASLCYSTTHLEELIEWDPFERVIALAGWIEDLKPIWCKSADRALDRELEWWLRKELGLPRSAEYLPVSASFTGVIQGPSSPSGSADLLAVSRIPDMVREVYSRRAQLPDIKGFSTDSFQKLHRDRMRRWPAEMVENVRNERIAQALEGSASQLWPKLVADRPGLSELDVVDAAHALARQPGSLPLDRLFNRTLGGLAKKVTAQEANSQGFRRRYRSATHDLMHLTGAAYGDIFTCDQRIDEAIGTARTERGLLPQLSVRGAGGSHAFVDALERQVAQLLETT